MTKLVVTSIGDTRSVCFYPFYTLRRSSSLTGQCYAPALHHITVPVLACGKCPAGLPDFRQACKLDTVRQPHPRLLLVDDKGGQDSCHVEHHDLRTVIHYMARVACFAWFSVAPVGGRERRWLTCSHARKKVIRQMKIFC